MLKHASQLFAYMHVCMCWCIKWQLILLYLQAATSDSTLTETDCEPFIAVIGDPLQPEDHKVIIEKTVVLKHMDTFSDALSMFLGLIYALNLKFNGKHTFDFLQRRVLQLTRNTSMSKKATTLLSKLP